MSGEYRVRDPNRSVALSSVSLRVPHDYDVNRSARRDVTENGGNLNYSQALLRSGNEKRVVGMTPNGSAKMINGVGSSKEETHKNSVSSTKSDDIDQSKPTLSTHWLFSARHGVQSSLVSLTLLTLASLALAFLATQLLYRLNDNQKEENSAISESLGSSFETIQDVSLAIASFALVLDVCCVLVCSLQLFFALKLLRFTQGDDRCVFYVSSVFMKRNM